MEKLVYIFGVVCMKHDGGGEKENVNILGENYFQVLANIF